MARYRIGNDLTILWKVYDREGKALFLNDKEVHLFYTCERGRFEADINIQEDNIVVWNFYGSLQKTLGEYSLTLEIFQSEGMRSIKKDVCGAFVFVGKDCEADVKDTTVSLNGEVVAHQEIIKTNLDVCRVSPVIPYVVRDENGIGYWYVDGVNTGDRSTGETAYEYAKSQGYTGTEEDFAKMLVEAPDWNASQRKAGHIKGRSHYIDGAHAIPFEQWDKRFDEDGNAIYSRFLSSESIFGCLIREGYLEIGEVNYIFFGTEWKSLSPATYADIRINHDSESAISVLEIKLYRYGDPEEFLANFINNALFAYGFSEDFIYPIANEFIPDTIARTNDVDELREETTALWENLDHGTFPDLVAGDLAGRGESVPAEFGFRASGGKSIKDGRAYIKRIKGNSVVWNQLYKPFDTVIRTQTINGVTFSVYEDGTIEANGTAEGGSAFITLMQYTNFLASHKYILIAIGAPVGKWTNQGFYFTGISGINTSSMIGAEGYKIFQPSADGESGLNLTCWSGYSLSCKFRPMFVDLTKAFPNDWQNINTIEEFNARVATLGIEDMNAYNEGEVIHCNTESIKSVGDNAWDEEWRNGHYSTPTGIYNKGSQSVCNANPIRVLPNQEYYNTRTANGYMESYAFFYDADMNFISYASMSKGAFTTPANSVYMNFYFAESSYGTTYNNDIMITLVHSGWKQDIDAGYQPYWQDTLPLPIIRKYFPQGMKKAGTAHDEIRYNKASGKWEYSKGKMKSVDLGTLPWRAVGTTQGGTRFKASVSDIKPVAQAADQGNILCAKYDSITADGTYFKNKGIAVETSKEVSIYDEAYTDTASFKAMLQEKQVVLYYESNDWEWVELDAEDQNFRDYYNVADFGTEQSQSSVPSAPFSADIIYQFNAVDMIRENYNEIEKIKAALAKAGITI